VKQLSSFLAISALLLCAATVYGQVGKGSISGTVTDLTGASVSGARVTLLNPGTGTTRHTVTSTAGLYTFGSLNPGTYQVKASHTGFSNAMVNNVVVTVDQITSANIKLQVGAATETVTVSATTNLIDTSNSTVGAMVQSKTLDEAPLLYRNVYDLAQLTAGVNAPNGSPGSTDSMVGIQDITTGRPGVDISGATINGSIAGAVSIMIDGSPINVLVTDDAITLPAMDINEDAVDEVRMETQNTSASVQSSGAGVISVSTKSGTNSIHGDVFAQFRPNAFSANEYFNKQTELNTNVANTPPEYHRYQEGAAIGGPILKDRLFYFGDYQSTQQEQYEGIDYFSVPTAAEKTGNFSAASFNIYNPTQPENPNGTRQPFPGNTIPNPNPIGLLFLSKMPACNLPSPTVCEAATTDVVNNYGVPGLDPYHQNSFDVRLDWDESQNQHIFGRLSYDRLNSATANAFPSGWDWAYAQNLTDAYDVVLGDGITLNPSTLLQLRYSFVRHNENQGNPGFLSNNITAQGFPSSLAAAIPNGASNIPYIYFDDVGGGVGGTAFGNVLEDIEDNHDIIASIEKTWGKHQISLGFEGARRYMYTGRASDGAGGYGFDISSTDQQTSPSSGVTVGGSDFASALLGMGESNGDSGDIVTPVFVALSNPYYGAFVEDTVTASHSLTITAGLRWDIFAGQTERHNRLEYFDPTATNTYNGVSYTGAAVYTNSSNRNSYAINKTDFGPRLAVAWQPASNFVVRGGGGFYYGPSTSENGRPGNQGYSATTPWNDSCIDAAGNSVYYSPGCAAPVADNFAVPYSLSNPFPEGLDPVFSIAHPAPAGLANELGLNLSQAPLYRMPTPVTYDFNFGVEYELPHQVVVDVGYVGSRGLFLPGIPVAPNQLTLAQYRQYNTSLCIKPNPSCIYYPNQWAGIQPKTNALYGQSMVPLWYAIQPFPQFGSGSYSASGGGISIVNSARGDSEYSSMQVKVQKRLSNNMSVLSTFTWGKLMSDDSNPPIDFVGSHAGSIQDTKDLYLEHSIAAQDIKYSWNALVTYQLPFGRGQRVNLNGFANQALGGWTVSGIAYLSTGVPVASPPSGLTPSYFPQRADMTCNPATGAPHTEAHWLNDNCFAIPGTEGGGAAVPYIPGNAPTYLDSVRTQGARDLDLSLLKYFRFGAEKSIRFQVSGYNMTNTPQLGTPSIPTLSSALSGSSLFGQITNTLNTPRQFQFGTRFTF
jgi:hypothetical protein